MKMYDGLIEILYRSISTVLLYIWCIIYVRIHVNIKILSSLIVFLWPKILNAIK